MSLWIISELFPPEETSTAFILGEIANVMVEKYDVKVICGPEIYDKKKEKDPNNSFILNSRVKVQHVKGVNTDKNTILGRTTRFLIISKQLYKVAKDNVKKEDKVLLVTNPAPIIFLISKLKKKKKFELNILVHDVFPENTKSAGIKLPHCIYAILKRVFDNAYSRADQLIALGRDMKKVLEEKVARFEHQPKVTIIENWADLDIVSPYEQKSHQDKFIMEYAGNIGRLQGLQQMLYCIREANNDMLEFNLWGTGADENKLKEYTIQNKMLNVFFHGSYPRSKQNEIINGCDLALVTLSEGMFGLGVPSKTYNIMGAGKAILFIGDPQSEIGLLVREKIIGYVFRPEDKKGIIGFLSGLNKEKLIEIQEMGERARQVAVKEYAKEIILKKYIEAI